MCGERPEAQRSLKFRSTASSQIERIGTSFESGPERLYLASLFVRLEIKSLPMEKKLHIFVCQRLGRRSYAEFDEKLKELRAVPLMHSIWAVRTVFTATELKDVLRKLLDNQDRILVVEIRGDWASRRAENNLAELIPPRGGPALMLWKRRWGE